LKVRSGIRRWHWGKLVILWAWGSVIVAFLLAVFVPNEPREQPWVSSLALLGSVVTLVVLSSVTWHWLGSKEDGSGGPSVR
jgi:hypothetical protein